MVYKGVDVRSSDRSTSLPGLIFEVSKGDDMLSHGTAKAGPVIPFQHYTNRIVYRIVAAAQVRAERT